MGQAVLISIRPKWCELIANGKKTVEVRKNSPKLKTPFKCYIYCTKPSKRHQTICGCMVLNSDELFRHPRKGIKYGASIELMCEDDYKTIARHEILCNLEDIFKSAFHLLKTGGNMFVVYRPDRLSTLFSEAKSAKLEIKNMTYVHSKENAESKLVLCKLQKGAKEGMKISRPFIMYDKNGEYSEDYITVRDKGVMEIG